MAKRTIVLTTRKKLARGTGLSSALEKRAAYKKLLAEMAKVNPRDPISIRNFFKNTLPRLGPIIPDFPLNPGEILDCGLEFFAEGVGGKKDCLPGQAGKCPADYTCPANDDCKTKFTCPGVSCPNGFTCQPRFDGPITTGGLFDADIRIWVEFVRFVQRLGVTFV